MKYLTISMCKWLRNLISKGRISITSHCNDWSVDHYKVGYYFLWIIKKKEKEKKAKVLSPLMYHSNPKDSVLTNVNWFVNKSYNWNPDNCNIYILNEIHDYQNLIHINMNIIVKFFFGISFISSYSAVTCPVNLINFVLHFLCFHLSFSNKWLMKHLNNTYAYSW